jgi:hypothetical protein
MPRRCFVGVRRCAAGCDVVIFKSVISNRIGPITRMHDVARNFGMHTSSRTEDFAFLLHKGVYILWGYISPREWPRNEYGSVVEFSISIELYFFDLFMRFSK